MTKEPMQPGLEDLFDEIAHRADVYIQRVYETRIITHAPNVNHDEGIYESTLFGYPKKPHVSNLTDLF